MAQAEDQSGESRLDDAVLGFIEARMGGKTPDLDGYVKDYPDLEQDIRRRIASYSLVDSLFDSVKHADASEFPTAETDCSLIGAQVGGFKIVEIIGQGGMGVVYKAEDTRLNRLVAIKSIPGHLLDDEVAQARFRREAKLLAALNHPNIALIHDIIDPADRTCYLVLEYVPGTTLTEQIADRSLKVRDVLLISRQIAEALAAAYEKGIIHRDLKPANVKIMPNDNVKVLDFGIAKVGGPVSELQETSVTQDGHIVGTPAYMSPEQTRGRHTDHRTDIWSFGCVMYEMLTGHIPFTGETATDTIARILEREPDWTELPPDLPQNIRVLLRRCLEKDPKQRLQHIGDAVVEITETLSMPTVAPPVTAVSTSVASSPGKRRLKWAIPAIFTVIVMTVVLIAVKLLRHPSSTATEPRPVRFAITLPQSQHMGDPHLWTSKLALSPDGSSIVYVASQNGIDQLFARELDSMEPRLIPGTEDAHSPFFLPDGNWVAFFTESRIKRVSLETGTILDICFVSPLSYGGFWSVHDNSIYFTANPNGGLFKVSTTGDGTPVPVTEPDYVNGEKVHTQPRMLPGGKDLLFTIDTYEGAEKRDIALLSLETNDWQRLGIHGSNAYYVAYGTMEYLVYAGSGCLLAVPFDLANRKVLGPEARVLDGVLTDPSAQFDLSEKGTLVYAPRGVEASKSTVASVDLQGGITHLPFEPDMYHGPRLSPDGSRLALIKGWPNWDVYVCDLARPSLTKITSNPGWDLWPTWEPVGNRITYSSVRASNGDVPSLFSISSDGSHEEPLLEANLTEAHLTACWSRDQERLAFVKISADVNEMASFDIWVLSKNDKMARGFLTSQFNEKMPAFHPGGDWIAYASDESGRYEVYVRQFPSGRERKQISFDGGDEPMWDPSGRTLFYRSGNTMRAVRLEDETSFSFGKSEDLFTEWFARNKFAANYDFDAKSQRFIIIKPTQAESVPVQINVVLNWFEELKQNVP